MLPCISLRRPWWEVQGTWRAGRGRRNSTRRPHPYGKTRFLPPSLGAYWAAGCYHVTGLLVGYGWVTVDPLVLPPGGAMVGDALAPATTCSVVTGGAGGPAFD